MLWRFSSKFGKQNPNEISKVPFVDERDTFVSKRPGTLAPVIRALLRPEITIGVIFVALLLEKLKLMLPAARGPIVFAILQHDGAVVALLLLLYVAGLAAVNRDIKGKVSRAAAAIFGKLCMAVFLLVLLLYAADTFTYKFFATRLYASDLVTFSFEPRAVLSLIHVG